MGLDDRLQHTVHLQALHLELCTSKEGWLANTPWKRLWVPAKLDWEFAAGDQVSPSSENFLLATQAMTQSSPAIQWNADEPGNARDKSGCSLASSRHLRWTRQKCITTCISSRLESGLESSGGAKLRSIDCMLRVLLSKTPDTGICIFSPDWLGTDQATEVLRQRLRADLCMLTTLQLDIIS